MNKKLFILTLIVLALFSINSVCSQSLDGINLEKTNEISTGDSLLKEKVPLSSSSVKTNTTTSKTTNTTKKTNTTTSKTTNTTKKTTNTTKTTAKTTTNTTKKTNTTVSMNVKTLAKASTTFMNYVNKNGKLKSTISISNHNYTTTEYLYLLSKAINSTNKTKVDINTKLVNKSYVNTNIKSINGTINKTEYGQLAGKTMKFIEKNKRAPNWVTSSKGNIPYNQMVLAFSKCLDQYNQSGKFPSSIKLNDLDLNKIKAKLDALKAKTNTTTNTSKKTNTTTSKTTNTTKTTAKTTTNTTKTTAKTTTNTTKTSSTSKTTTKTTSTTKTSTNTSKTSSTNNTTSTSLMETTLNSIKSILQGIADRLDPSKSVLNINKTNTGNIAVNTSSVSVKISGTSNVNVKLSASNSTKSTSKNTTTASKKTNTTSKTNTTTKTTAKTTLKASTALLKACILNEKYLGESLSKYLASTKNCQVKNTAIKLLSNKLTKSLKTDYDKAKNIFNWVRDYVSYKKYANSLKGATKTLSSKSGNCVDQSHLLVALTRAAGIPARYVHGQNCKFTSGYVSGHVWAQVLVNNTWVVADTTSSKNTFGVIKNWNVNSYTLKGKYSALSF